jgi:hypothetical protein
MMARPRQTARQLAAEIAGLAARATSRDPLRGWKVAGNVRPAPADDMEGECAADHAWGVPFFRGDGRQTIWAFAAECGPKDPGRWFVAFKIDHDNGDWHQGLFYGDVDYSDSYPSLDKADEAARQAVSHLILGDTSWANCHLPPPAASNWFAWDGTPW